MPESSSEDGNDSSPDSPLSPPVPPVGGFREETISKEKQKFFRLNLFYGSKGRGRERCKVEGRPVRDLSSSSNSSSSDSSDIDSSKSQPVLPSTPKSSSLPNHTLSVDQSALPTSRESMPDPKEVRTGVAASGEPPPVVNEPFSSFGMFGQCVTFEDLAKRCQANDKSEEELPVCKKSSVTSWLQKLKSTATDGRDSSWKKDVGRSAFAASKTEIEPTQVKRPFGRPADDGAGVKNASAGKRVGEPNHASDSWHNLIKPSSSIPSQKSIRTTTTTFHKPLSEPLTPAKTEDQNTAVVVAAARAESAEEEELWGFAAAAARKKVTPVLRLDKEGTPGYAPYNVFVPAMWNKDPLKNVTNVEATYATAAVAAAAAVPAKSEPKFVVAAEAPKSDDSAPPQPPDNLPLALSPSKLVKTAVLSKQYEHIRRNMLTSNTPLLVVNQLGDVVPSDKESIKKKLIAEATKTRHFQVCRHLNHLSVQPVSVPPSRPYNQSGKIITSYLNKKRKKKKIPFNFLTPFRFYQI